MYFEETIKLMDEVDRLQLAVYTAPWMGNIELEFSDTTSAKLKQIRDLVAGYMRTWTPEEVDYVNARITAVEAMARMIIAKSKDRTRRVQARAIMDGKQLDREIAALLGWIGMEPTSYFIDYPGDTLYVYHWRGIPPQGAYYENLPRWSADLNAQIWLCRSRGWNISYASGQPVVVQIRTAEKHLYGASHPTNVWEAGAMAIYHALKEELRVSNPVTE